MPRKTLTQTLAIVQAIQLEILEILKITLNLYCGNSELPQQRLEELHSIGLANVDSRVIDSTINAVESVETKDNGYPTDKAVDDAVSRIVNNT